MVVQQPMQRLGAARQFQEIALQRFGEGVEQAPHVARLKLLVVRVAPFMENLRDVPVAAHAHIEAADHEIVGRAVFQVRELVAGDALVLVMPALHQLAHGTLHKLRQIAGDEPRVLPGEFHLPRKREVVAAEHGGTGDDPGGERLVVAVANAEHPAVVLVGLRAQDLHEPEIAQAVVGQAVRLGADDKAVAADGVFDLGDEIDVRDRSPAHGGPRSGHCDDVFPGNGAGAAVKDEIGGGPADGSGRGLEKCIHDDVFFRFEGWNEVGPDSSR